MLLLKKQRLYSKWIYLCLVVTECFSGVELTLSRLRPVFPLHRLVPSTDAAPHIQRDTINRLTKTALRNRQTNKMLGLSIPLVFLRVTYHIQTLAHGSSMWFKCLRRGWYGIIQLKLGCNILNLSAVSFWKVLVKAQCCQLWQSN